ncbi:MULTISPECIES: GNAT family N-acetyltransferase [Paenibacillus]|jgi:putative acetyltransferase|uniref:GNAT family N-acetyltransferase n=1 Tax=Paenibacillus TaxID=44249 RepID=UPI00096DE106|nr:GNAT family N-acetyltransferase [Paenibacillus odorifer]OMD57571.1 GNAT family N-acetyltransferase [Paenibacillus odorifer]OMD76023.1 GNAT family N-acetyltransferase [Paenibacillus odorifer]
MDSIKIFTTRNEELLNRLLNIWESSVRHTHLFLSEQDIDALRPLVTQALEGISDLFAFTDDEEQLLGFIGVQNNKIEMLFVEPAAMGKGVGKALVAYVMQKLAVYLVDVNEQNPQALGFYEHMGFQVFERSALDEQGNPFPILHMSLK